MQMFRLPNGVDQQGLTKKLSGPPSEAREARGAAEELEDIDRAGPGPLKRLVERSRWRGGNG
jgi:hypothetical protein